jgi:hypothetical protein
VRASRAHRPRSAADHQAAFREEATALAAAGEEHANSRLQTPPHRDGISGYDAGSLAASLLRRQANGSNRQQPAIARKIEEIRPSRNRITQTFDMEISRLRTKNPAKATD